MLLHLLRCFSTTFGPVGLYVLLAVLLPSCGGGGGGLANPTYNLLVQSDRLDGGINTQFGLTASVVPTADVDIVWLLGDGRQATGQAVEVQYADPGVYQVTAQATLRSNSTALAPAVVELTVLDPLGGVTLQGTDIPMPALLGDVDDSGSLTTLDVDRITAHLQGTQPLSAEQWRSADFELDGDVDANDATLLATAVAQNGLLPTSMQPASGPRLTLVRIMAEALRSVDARVEARVGQSQPIAIRRIRPGYGVFPVPMDAVGPATIAPIVEGEVQVQLLVDGTVVHTLPFLLTNPDPIVGDEPALVRTTAVQLAAAASNLRADWVAQADAFGIVGQDQQVLGACLEHVRNELVEAQRQIDAFVQSLTPQQSAALSYLAAMQGLRGQAQTVARLAAPRTPMEGTPSSAEIAATLCSIQDLLESVQGITTVMQGACVALTAGAALSSLLPFVGPLGLGAAASIGQACTSLAAAESVLSIFANLVPRPAESLTCTVRPDATAGRHLVKTELQVNGLGICGYPAAAAQDLLMEWATRRLAAWLGVRWVSSYGVDARTGALRSLIATTVRGILNGVGVVLTATGLDERIQSVRDSLCNWALGTSRITLRPSELTSLNFSPANAGQWASLDGIEAVFACAASGPDNVTVTAVWDACQERRTGSVGIYCGDLPNVPGMVRINPGTFSMGSNAPIGQPPYYNLAQSQPVHPVTITRPFLMGQYEVTQAQYQAVMGSNPSFFPGANRPVEQVTWNNAMAYCAALTASEAAQGRVPSGYQYRLPTEAEWEYCCRAGTTSEFSFGPSLTCGMANFYNEVAQVYCVGATSAVGSYPANPWQLFDMHGNVWEWCLDSWDFSANYPSSAVSDPYVSSGPLRVGRGGSWLGNSIYCRSAYRGDATPGVTNYILGFRVCLAPVLVP